MLTNRLAVRSLTIETIVWTAPANMVSGSGRPALDRERSIPLTRAGPSGGSAMAASGTGTVQPFSQSLEDASGNALRLGGYAEQTFNLAGGKCTSPRGRAGTTRMSTASRPSPSRGDRRRRPACSSVLAGANMQYPELRLLAKVAAGLISGTRHYFFLGGQRLESEPACARSSTSVKIATRPRGFL
jgi:hypothetical protein